MEKQVEKLVHFGGFIIVHACIVSVFVLVFVFVTKGLETVVAVAAV